MRSEIAMCASSLTPLLDTIVINVMILMIGSMTKSNHSSNGSGSNDIVAKDNHHNQAVIMVIVSQVLTVAVVSCTSVHLYLENCG